MRTIQVTLTPRAEAGDNLVKVDRLHSLLLYLDVEWDRSKLSIPTALTSEPLDPGAGLQVTVSPLTPPIHPQVKEWI
jgi:hypothetical protein